MIPQPNISALAQARTNFSNIPQGSSIGGNPSFFTGGQQNPAQSPQFPGNMPQQGTPQNPQLIGAPQVGGQLGNPGQQFQLPPGPGQAQTNQVLQSIGNFLSLIGHPLATPFNQLHGFQTGNLANPATLGGMSTGPGTSALVNPQGGQIIKRGK